MLISKTDKYYRVLDDNAADAVEYPATFVDAWLTHIRQAVRDIESGLDELEETAPLLFRQFENETGDTNYANALRQIAEFCKNLSKYKDEIPPKEDLLTLQHLGYTPTIHNGLYEKILEDNSARTVTEEVTVLSSGGHLHRKRTIEWTATPTGRTSNSITYEQLPVDNELAVAIANTCRRPCCKCKCFNMSDRYEPICTAKKRCIHNSCERCDKFEPLTLPSPRKERRAEK